MEIYKSAALRNKIPVLLCSEMLDFALDSLSGRFQDDALQQQEVVLVKHLLLLQRAYDLVVDVHGYS